MSLKHLYRMTVAQYDQIAEAGGFGERDRLELVDGFLLAMEERSRLHIFAGKKSFESFQRIVTPAWHVARRDPVVVSEYSKPDPDVTVVRGQIRDYIERDVSADDIGVVLEISDTGLYARQRDLKRIYAASRIPYYWIINIVESQVEVYSDPDGQDYRSAQVFTRDQEVPVILDGAEVGRIRVVDLLPVL